MSDFSQDRNKLLGRLLRQKGIGGPRANTIPRRAPGAKMVASFLQEGLWFLDQFDPGKATYNVPGATRIHGPLNVAALQATLNEIVSRHEALRTRFGEEGGKPVQIVEPDLPVDLTPVDLSNLSRAQCESEVLQRATDEARRPFDLAAGPLFRFALLRLRPDEHVLVLNIHHTVTDGWSMGVFTRELFALYEAFSNGRPSPLPELPIQFADFAIWQRQRLSGERLEGLLAFWRRQLSGVLPVLELPPDKERPKFQSCAGGHATMRMSDSLSSALRKLTQRQDRTLFELLLAAFNVLLYRYTGQEDIIVGSPVASRDRKELEPLIGYFVNMIPLRTDLSGDPSFPELIDRVRRVTMDAYSHQELPFNKLVEELGVARDTGRNPVFQVEFILLTQEHAPAVYGYGFRSPIQESHELCDLKLTPIEVESGVAKFDLVVLLWDVPDGISGTFEFNADLFEAETIERMIRNFDLLLNRIVALPESSVKALAEALPLPQKTPRPVAVPASPKKFDIKKIRRKTVANFQEPDHG